MCFAASAFCKSLYVPLERRVEIPREALVFGGVLGLMRITDCVIRSNSPWFCGPWGFVIEQAVPVPFRPCRGSLGFFNLPPEIREALSH